LTADGPRISQHRGCAKDEQIHECGGVPLPPIKISQLAYLISRLLICLVCPGQVPDGAFLPMAGRIPAGGPAIGRSISRPLLHARCFVARSGAALVKSSILAPAEY